MNNINRIFWVFAGIVIILIILSFGGCAKRPFIYKTHCKEEPKLLNIQVKDNCICGDALKALIDNHIFTYEYMEYLKIKGCVK